jgi:dethiobiotin synthetase
VGEANPDSEGVICAFSDVKRLGRLPFVDPLDQANLQQAFMNNFNLDDFR